MVAAWSSTRGSPVACHYRPPLSVGTVSTVLGGLDEALFREAEERRERRRRSEAEAYLLAQEQCKPRISRHSQALYEGRLERELRHAFEACEPTLAGCPPEVLGLPTSFLPRVLGNLDLLSGADEEEIFCENLALLLDQEDTGVVTFKRLLAFLVRALDRDGQQQPRVQQLSLEEECYVHLEQQLSRSLGRLLSNRLARPKSPGRSASPALRTNSTKSEESQRMQGASPTTAAAAPISTPPPVVRATTPRRRVVRSVCQGCDSDPEGISSSSQVARPRSARSATRSEHRGQAQQLSRCHLLYHQAVFASRESAQLEEEIKILKQREEMRECTFRPKLTPTRRNSNLPVSQPRNFETAVARMRSANQRRMQRREESEYVPCGENYERLRRLGAQPFSCYFKDKAPSQPPLMYVDVKVGHGRTGRIRVREGDNLHALSRNFARTFQLDRKMAKRLEEMLHQAYMSKMQTPSWAVPPEAPPHENPSPAMEEEVVLQSSPGSPAAGGSSSPSARHTSARAPMGSPSSPSMKPPAPDPLASPDVLMAGDSEELSPARTTVNSPVRRAGEDTGFREAAPMLATAESAAYAISEATPAPHPAAAAAPVETAVSWTAHLGANSGKAGADTELKEILARRRALSERQYGAAQ